MVFKMYLDDAEEKGALAAAIIIPLLIIILGGVLCFVIARKKVCNKWLK